MEAKAGIPDSGSNFFSKRVKLASQLGRRKEAHKKVGKLG
jgi:hypothetical protein